MRPCVVVTFSFLFCLGSLDVRAEEPCPARDTQIIGHRGTGTNGDAALPENTIASAQRAVEEGATMVEIDVQLSSDGVLYVMHDDTVDRTTDGTGCTGNLTAAELDALSADGEPVPTLAALLAAVTIPLNVEIKVNEDDLCPATDKPALAAELAAVLAADPTPRDILISSFDLDQLLAVRAADDTLALAYLITSRDEVMTAIDQGFEAVNPLSIILREADITQAQAAGLAVYPYTVNDAPNFRRLLGFGVDGIITDEPDLMLEAVDAYCVELCASDAGVPDAGSPDAGTAMDAGPGMMSGGGGCSVGSASSGSTPLLLLCLLWATRRRSRGNA